MERNRESWTMSVDNYYNLRQQTGSEGIITINYAYARYGTSANPVAAAAHLAADWVRYDNGRTKYWEIGNEDNGTWRRVIGLISIIIKDGQPEIVRVIYMVAITRYSQIPCVQQPRNW